MSEDNTKIAQSIRSGRYFTEARAWYKAIYIGPISERSLFLVIAILAVIIGFSGILALSSLLPLSSSPAFPIPAGERAEERISSLIRLKRPEAPLNPTMLEFFVNSYVLSRESYSAKQYQLNALFIQSHSDDKTYAEYSGLYTAGNPASPAATLGENGQRVVGLLSSKVMREGDSGTATVAFTTELVGTQSANKTLWTARIEYHYTDMKVETVIDEKTGQETMKVTDPIFQVVGYKVEKN